MMRWVATIYYRTERGTIDVDHAFDELEDLHDIVERGPSWYAIEKIEIRYAQPTTHTIESAEAE